MAQLKHPYLKGLQQPYPRVPGQDQQPQSGTIVGKPVGDSLSNISSGAGDDCKLSFGTHLRFPQCQASHVVNCDYPTQTKGRTKILAVSVAQNSGIYS